MRPTDSKRARRVTLKRLFEVSVSTEKQLVTRYTATYAALKDIR